MHHETSARQSRPLPSCNVREGVLGRLMALFVVVVAALGLSGCGDGDAGRARDADIRSNEAPGECKELDASDAIAELPDQLRAGVSGEVVDVGPVLEELRAAEDEFPSIGPAADALEAWAADPLNPSALDAVAEQFGALDGEIAESCDTPS